MNIYHDSLTRSMTLHLRVIASRRVLSIFQVDGVPLDTVTCLTLILAGRILLLDV